MATTHHDIAPELLRRSTSSVLEATERVLRVSQSPGKSAFVARALNALATLMEEIDERTLADAAGASSDAQALLKALEQPEVLALLRMQDPLLPARLRGLYAKQQILEAEGGSIGVAEVAKLLGITRQAVDKRRRAGTLIGLNTGKRGYLYPIWQFHPSSGMLPGLDEVIEELAEFGPWMKAGYLLSPNLRLDGRRPIDALRAGDIEKVRWAANAYGGQGAA